MMKTEDIGLPSLVGSKGTMDDYVVKYYKADLNDPVDMLSLCDIETRAIRAKPGKEQVVLIEKTTFSFMDKYYIIIKYLEKVVG